MQKIERAGIIFAIITSVVGVAVSLVSLLISLEANKLARMQYELDLYGGEPVFMVEWELGKDGLPYYTITNTGAEIHDVSYDVVDSYHGYFASRVAGFESGLLPNGFSFKMHANYIAYDTEFIRQTQSFVVLAYRRFKDKPSEYYYDIAENTDVREVARGPVWPQKEVNITIDYKNFRNESCRKRIVIFMRMGAQESHLGKDFTFRVSDPQDEEEQNEMLIIDIWDHEEPVKKIVEAIAQYRQENDLVPYGD